MKLNPLTWFGGDAEVKTEATAAIAVAPGKAINLFDVVLGTLKKRSAGHPMLIQAETWIQSEVDAHGAALLQEAEAAVISALEAEFPGLSAVLPASATAAPAPAAAK